MPLEIVDPHIHLWDLSTGLYPGLAKPSTGFIGSNAPIARSYLLEEFLAEAGDEVRLAGAVHVEAFPTDPLAETKALQAVADRAPIPVAIVANADLSHPAVGQLLAAHAAHPAFRGIRQVVNRHRDPLYAYVERDFMNEPAWRDGFRELAKVGASFDLQLYPQQFATAAEIAAANPDITIVLNHAGMWVDRTLAGWRDWRDGLRVLAARPNIHVKISGLGMFDRNWTRQSIRPLVFETLDAFGVERSMFASNFPVDKLFSTYDEVWLAFADAVADLPAPEQAALFAGTARRIYRL